MEVVLNPSACLQHGGSSLVRVCQNFIADLSVGDRSVLLPQVQPQLTLMTKAQITLLTLGEEGENGCIREFVRLNINTDVIPVLLNNFY